MRKTPRSALSANGSPSAATTMRRGSRGSISTRAICDVLANPIFAHVLPPSVEW
ncbi:hypothetical protein [Vulcanimicrobium alpinum]|uniref:hypothetical protein n=1 Tax=Vulcanimicrobium alpinum TaxID=3016050 RepID=UPI00295E5031|nr:hypothetical protein [Vulcanimicrobium alpinum]